MEIKGKIEKVMDVQQISDTFKKRDFVIVTSGEYPQHVKMQATQTRCDVLDNFKVGQQVTVRFDLKGRPYEKDGKMMYFTNVEAWAINADSEVQAPPPAPVETPVDDNSPLPF